MLDRMTEVSVRVEQNIGEWREGEIRIVERTPRIDTMIRDGRLTVGNWFQTVADPATNAVVDELNLVAATSAIAALVAPGDEGIAEDVKLAFDAFALEVNDFPTEYKTPGFLGVDPALGPPIGPPRRKRRRATTTDDGQPDAAPDA